MKDKRVAKYNAIAQQIKTDSSRITAREWNHIINVLKEQANQNAMAIDSNHISAKESEELIDKVEKRVNQMQEEFEKEVFGYIITDKESVDVSIELKDGVDVTFTKELNSLEIKIPKNAGHGYISGINFRFGDTIYPTVINNSELPLKIIKYNLELTNIQLSLNKTVNMSFYSDGLNIYCHYIEV